MRLYLRDIESHRFRTRSSSSSILRPCVTSIRDISKIIPEERKKLRLDIGQIDPKNVFFQQIVISIDNIDHYFAAI